MYKKSKSVLLLSDVTEYCRFVKDIADKEGVYFSSESSWDKDYRVLAETVLLGSKFLDSLNPSYYKSAVIILKPEENPLPFLEKGITRFIFDYRSVAEISFAFYKIELVTIAESKLDYTSFLDYADINQFCFGSYEFKFDQDSFKWKGKNVFISKAEKRFLAEWLLKGRKDNAKRMYLCNLRKRLGAGFLKDVDKNGTYKGGKHE